MTKLSVITLILFNLCSFAIGSSRTFLDPAFNRLDPRELTHLQSTEKQSSELITFFQAEASYFRGRIHESQNLLESILKNCRSFDDSAKTPRITAICFLAELGFGTDVKSLHWHLKKDQVAKVLRAIQQNPFSFEERAYLEGRIFWRIPEELGGNPSQSLLGWESLKRLHPELSCSHFFIGQIHESRGNWKLARQAFEKALSQKPPDPRAQLTKSEKNKDAESRFYFGVVGNPAGGVGILIGKRDDRLADTQRALDVAISAQSRGVYLGRIRYQDEETFAPLELQGRLLAASEIDQFFGLGTRSELKNLTELSQSRSEGEVALRRWFSSFYSELGLGWFWREPSSVTGALSNSGSLRERQASLLANLELGWSDRNSGSAFFRFTGSQRGFGSTHSFEVLRVGVKKRMSFLPIGNWEWNLGFRALSGQNPFGMLSQISGNISLPGVRAGRFRDAFAWHGTLEWNHRLWQDSDIVAFGNLASLSESFEKLSGSPMLSGAGLGLVIGTGRLRSRIDYGYFAGETVIQTGVQFFSE